MCGNVISYEQLVPEHLRKEIFRPGQDKEASPEVDVEVTLAES